MEDERDLIDFEDDDGNVVTLEVTDYFFYEGEEYALLTDPEEEDSENCEGCEETDCGDCEYAKNVYVMKVVPVGEDEEEFVEVDEELARTLVDLIQSGAFDEDAPFDDEEAEEGDEGEDGE